MPMFASLTRLLRCRSGAPAVEFALIAPLLLVVVLGISETGMYLADQSALDRSLRAGAMVAARADLGPGPSLGAATQTLIGNLVKTGTPDGSGGYLLDGWSDAGASLDIDVDTVTLADPDATQKVVFTLTAVVPYDPFMPGLLGFLSNLTLIAVHEQAYIGN